MDTPAVRPRRFYLFPIERLVIAFGVMVIALFVLLSVQARTRADFYLKQTISAVDNYSLGLAICAVLVFAAHLLAVRRKSAALDLRGTWIRYLNLFLSPRQLMEDVRLLVGMLLTLALFTHLKHIVPLVNSSLFDEWCVAMEQMLFGKTLSELTIHAIGLSAAPFLSWCYTAYFVYMNAIAVIFILQRNQGLKHEFITAFALLWFIGALTIFAIPTWGPCFYLPDIFSSLPQTDVTVIQKQFWIQKLVLDKHPHHPVAIFYISGQPSLHIAITTLGSIYLARLWLPAAIASWIFVALTWITTLYFGWHYLIDNLSALLLVWIAIAMSRQMCRNVPSPVNQSPGT